MKKTKYMMSRGLAFSETSDMNRLRKKSLQGWHLKKFSFLGYQLEKGDKEDVVYTIDYRLLHAEDEHEYFDMFAFSGWKHVCSNYNMHIFKAPKGTKSIYSDVETTTEKYTRLIIPIRKLTLISFVVYITFLIVQSTTSGIIQTISEWGVNISFVIIIPLVMTLIAAYFHKWKYSYRKRGNK